MHAIRRRPRKRALLADVTARHGLWRADSAIAVLARGGENTTFRVGEIIVRRGGDPDAVVGEIRLLDALALATDVPVPAPLIRESGAACWRTCSSPLTTRRLHPA